MFEMPREMPFGLFGGGLRTRGLSMDVRLPAGGGLRARSVVGSVWESLLVSEETFLFNASNLHLDKVRSSFCQGPEVGGQLVAGGWRCLSTSLC